LTKHFGPAESPSGQFLINGHCAFSEFTQYGIPYHKYGIMGLWDHMSQVMITRKHKQANTLRKNDSHTE